LLRAASCASAGQDPCCSRRLQHTAMIERNAAAAPSNDTAAMTSWAPEREIAHTLELCEAQMEAALGESDHAVDALVSAFSSMVENASAARMALDNLPPAQRSALGDAAALRDRLAAVESQMAAAIVAFQFYDKLNQRLGHVRYSLSTLAMCVCDPVQSSQREQWQRLFSTLRRLYRTEEERRIFQMMIEGASAEQALERLQQVSQTLGVRTTGDIELF